MKKKFISITGALLLLVSLFSGCVSSGDRQNVTVGGNTDAGTTASPDTANTASTGSEPVSEEASLAEQVVYDANGVTVTVKGITYDSLWGTEIDLLIENTGTTDVVVCEDSIVINGYMITGYLYAEVAAGKSATEAVSLLQTELDAAGITQIATVQLYLYLTDPDTYSTIDTAAAVTLSTSAAGSYVQADDDEGEVLVDSDGIRIVAKFLGDDSIFGPSVVMYFENTTDKHILVQAENVSANGFMIDSFLYTELLPGTKAIDGLTMMQEDLDASGIEAIENMEFTLTVTDYDTYDTIYTSDVLQLTTTD